jgi:hypothetical protein
MLAEWFSLQTIRKYGEFWVDASSGAFGPGRKQEPPQGLKPWSLCALNGGLKPSSTLKQIFSPADILSSRYSFKQIFRQADKARWMESHRSLMGESSKHMGESSKNYGKS